MNEENKPLQETALQEPAAPQEKKKNKKLLLLLLLLLLLTLLSISLAIWALFFRGPDVTLSPDHAPADLEVNQTPIENDSGGKLDAEEGGGAVSLNYSPYVTIDLSDAIAVLMFANPGRSTQDMVVQLVIQDELFAQSDRLVPGNKITALKLLSGAEKKLSVGGYDGTFVVDYYDPETGELSIVNTEIPVSVSVVE